MPIDDFKTGRRGSNRPSDGLSFEYPRRDISAAGSAPRRRIDDFNRPEGYHVARRPITSSTGSPVNESLAQGKSATSPSLLYKNLTSKYPPLLADTKRKVPKPSLGRRLKRWSLQAGMVTGALVLIIAGFLAIKGYIKLHQIFKGGSAHALQVNQAGRINILLLGIGGAGHDGPDLTDTMLLVSIDPVNDKAVLLSVPRDLWVKMPNTYEGYYQKINAAYEAGKYGYLGEETDSNSNQKAIEAGFKSVDQAASQVLGETINYNVLVDFQAFEQGVNDVGGVTINVPTELYDPTMAWQNNWNPVLAKPGLQTMNGYKALLYVRSRETTSDFARTDRQRAVLVALKDKVLTLGTLSNPIKISDLISAFGNNVRTDISLNDAESLYKIMQKITNKQIQSVDLATPPNNLITTGDMGGLSIDEPRAGLFDYGAIRQYVHSIIKDGHLVKENAKITVLNGTDQAELATQTAATLKYWGYNVTSVANAPTGDYAKTIVVDLNGGRDKYTRSDLAQRFHTNVVTKLPDNTIKPNGADFVIIVGEDEATGG